MSLLASEKSMNMWDLYSFFANCLTIVDFPTRRAPSMRSAVIPLLFFHSKMDLYIFRLKISAIFI